MTVAVAVSIRFLAVVVDRQFKLGATLLVQQIHEGEALEREACRLREAERLLVESLRPVLIQNPDHRMNELSHRGSPRGLPVWLPARTGSHPDRRPAAALLRSVRRLRTGSCRRI